MAAAQANCFLFVDCNKPSAEYLATVRRHVMLHRRKQERLRKQGNMRTKPVLASTSAASMPLSQEDEDSVDEGQQQIKVSRSKRSRRASEGQPLANASANSPPSIVTLDGHRDDTFSTLSIKGTADTDSLVRWHFNKQCPFDSSWRRSFWELARPKPMLLHPLMCIAAVRRTSGLGNPPDALYFYHREQALEAMRLCLQGS